MRVRRNSIRAGSGGAGSASGGDGIERDLEMLEDVTVSLITERRDSQPPGLAGGEPGASGENWLLPGGDEDRAGCAHLIWPHLVALIAGRDNHFRRTKSRLDRTGSSQPGTPTTWRPSPTTATTTRSLPVRCLAGGSVPLRFIQGSTSGAKQELEASGCSESACCDAPFLQEKWLQFRNLS